MPHTVGLITHTGQISSHIYQNLLGPNNDGWIKLIILHRPSSNVSAVPNNVETRELDLDNGSDDDVHGAVQGLNVIICALPWASIHLQTRLIHALRDSKDLISYIPAEIGSLFTKEELVDPRLTPVLGLKQRQKEAEEAGISEKLTIIVSGEFTSAFLVLGYAEYMRIHDQANTRRAPLATAKYLGAGIAQLVTQDPTTFAGKHIQIYDHEPTGEELIDTLTRLHGSPTRLISVTTQELEDQMNCGVPVQCLGIALLKHWGDGHLEHMTKEVQQLGGWREEVRDWEPESLEEVIKRFL